MWIYQCLMLFLIVFLGTITEDTTNVSKRPRSKSLFSITSSAVGSPKHRGIFPLPRAPSSIRRHYRSSCSHQTKWKEENIIFSFGIWVKGSRTCRPARSLRTILINSDRQTCLLLRNSLKSDFCPALGGAFS